MTLHSIAMKIACHQRKFPNELIITIQTLGSLRENGKGRMSKTERHEEMNLQKIYKNAISP